MKTAALLLLVLLAPFVQAQKFEYTYRNVADSSRNCYLSVIPEGKIRGLIIRDFSSLPDTSRASSGFHISYAASGWMTLFVVSSKTFPDLAIDPEVLPTLDSIVSEVIEKYSIPRDNVFAGGVSSSGTRAVLYAQYCANGKSINGIKLAGVFAVDSPLDYERLWYESNHAVYRNYNEVAYQEGVLIMEHFTRMIGGAPGDYQKEYQSYSPFCYSAPIPGNEKWLVDIPIRLYIEPDINWWIDNKRKDYYDINALDAAALTNRLKLLGSKEAELVVTQDKGYTRSGQRHPHAWSIVDQKDLLSWIIAHSKP